MWPRCGVLALLSQFVGLSSIDVGKACTLVWGHLRCYTRSAHGTAKDDADDGVVDRIRHMVSSRPTASHLTQLSCTACQQRL